MGKNERQEEQKEEPVQGAAELVVQLRGLAPKASLMWELLD
jgi:hypothetical protein